MRCGIQVKICCACNMKNNFEAAISPPFPQGGALSAIADKRVVDAFGHLARATRCATPSAQINATRC